MSEPFDSGMSGDSGLNLSAADFGSPVTESTPQDTSQSQQQTQSTGTSQPDNPAWAPFLEGIPELFHNKLRGHLRQWDDNYRGLESRYQELEGRYKPFEQYNGVDPQAIGYGLNMFNAMRTNPMELHRLLTDYVTQQGLLQPQTPGPDSVDMDKDPYIAELEQRQAQLDARQAKMDEFVQQQMYQQSVGNYQAQIDKQIQDLVAKYGEAVDVQSILALMFNQVNQGMPMDANAAFEESKSMFQRMYQRQNQGKPAPNIIPPTGTIAPTAEKSVSQMSDEERQQYLVKMLQFANSGG